MFAALLLLISMMHSCTLRDNATSQKGGQSQWGRTNGKLFFLEKGKKKTFYFLNE